MSRTEIIRVTTTEDEIKVWRARGINTARKARHITLRAAETRGGGLTLPRPPAGGSTVFWYVRFSPAEVALIDTARGLAPRSKWIADVIGRSETPEHVLARDLRSRLLASARLRSTTE